MRTLALLFASAMAVFAQGVQWPELRGILLVDGPDKPAAILVLPTSAKGTYSAILYANGTDPGLDSDNIRVTRIDPAAGVVELRRVKSSETTELKLTTLAPGKNYLIHLERAPVRAA